MEQGQKQSHPFLIKNGKSQGSPNTQGFDGTNIKTAHNTAIESYAFVHVMEGWGFFACCFNKARILKMTPVQLDPHITPLFHDHFMRRRHEQLFKAGDSANPRPT